MYKGGVKWRYGQRESQKRVELTEGARLSGKEKWRSKQDCACNTDSLSQSTADTKRRQTWLETHWRRDQGARRKTRSHQQQPTLATLSFSSIYGNHWIIYKPLPLALCEWECVRGRERARGGICWAHHHHAVSCCCQCSCCGSLAAGSAGPRPVYSSWGQLRGRLQPLQPLLPQTDASSGSLCRTTAAPTLPHTARGTGVCHSVQTELWHSCLLCLPSQPWVDRERGRGGGRACGKHAAIKLVMAVWSVFCRMEFEKTEKDREISVSACKQ